MKISIAPPIQAHVPRALPVAPLSGAAVALASLPPASIDLCRQLKFGESEVDEAAILLVELSVLVYEAPDKIRRTLHKLDVDDLQVMDPRHAHMAEVHWPETQTRPPVRSQPPRALAIRHGSDVLVVFRGTQNGRDWALDFCLWPAMAWPLRHQGFQWTWHEVKSQIEAWLLEVEQHLGHPPNVYLGGHSLGGAVATLAAIDLAARYPIARVVTLGCPRAGGWLLRKRYRASPAAPSAAGTAAGTERRLPDITTRWVHGTDIVASLLPPPILTAHVVPSHFLRPDDRLSIEDYFPANFTDATPLTHLMSRIGTAPGPLSTLRAPSTPWTTDVRQIVGRVAMWLAFSLPWSWWTRMFLPLLPAAAEQLARSVGQHSAARYLGFMPPTALYRAMYPPRVPPAPALHQGF
jgi:pimeloyl-ACP methyl ester carboxylesterase